jgi:glycosyltransferase involved in cell wall biosynthesis
VLLMPSMGEGFGIPLLEAQACGVPVITSDHSAMTEIGTVGWQVGGDPWWDALQDSFLICPSVDGIVAALEAAYTARGDIELRERAVRFAAAYDADTVLHQHWLPALERLADRELAGFEAVA